jgi:hypothetical protein
MRSKGDMNPSSSGPLGAALYGSAPSMIDQGPVGLLVLMLRFAKQLFRFCKRAVYVEMIKNMLRRMGEGAIHVKLDEATARPFTAAPARPAAVACLRNNRQHVVPHLSWSNARKHEAAPPMVPPPAPPRASRTPARSSSTVLFPAGKLTRATSTHLINYVVPRDAVGQEAFPVIRDAMAAKGLVGMDRVVLADRERPIFIEPMGLGLRGDHAPVRA